MDSHNTHYCNYRSGLVPLLLQTWKVGIILGFNFDLRKVGILLGFNFDLRKVGIILGFNFDLRLPSKRKLNF